MSEFQDTLNAANRDDAKAQYRLGEMYRDAEGVARNDSEATKWFRRAADQGYEPAQAQMGIAYKNGRGVARDACEAVKWLRKAADQGHAQAQGILGEMYRDGEEIAQDYSEALKWLRLAAEQNLDYTLYVVGKMYQHGEGVAQNNDEAEYWIRQAAKEGYPKANAWLRNAGDFQGLSGLAGQSDIEAQFDLGEKYDSIYDFKEGRRWYRLAAAQAYAPAQYVLGCNSYDNEDEATKWYRLAAEQGHVLAQVALGNIYQKMEDYSEATKWYRLAAEKGDIIAHVWLGRVYRDHLVAFPDYYDYESNYNEAKKSFHYAAKRGHQEAQFELGELYYWGSFKYIPKPNNPDDPEDCDVCYFGKNIKEAVRWYREAAEQGHAKAQDRLNNSEDAMIAVGDLYRDGEGVPQNDSEAAKWYMEASQRKDSAPARLRLGKCYVGWKAYGTSGVPDNIMEFARQCAIRAGLIPREENTCQPSDTETEDADPRESNQWTDDDNPEFKIDGWEALDVEKIEAELMSRHFLILGETGSGKTGSGVKPLLKSILRHESSDPDKAAAILVIDPKLELSGFVDEQLRKILKLELDERRTHLTLNSEKYRLHAFEGEKDFHTLSADEILEISLPLSVNYDKKGTHDPYWVLRPTDVIRDVLAVVLECYYRKNDKNDCKYFWDLLRETIIESAEDEDSKNYKEYAELNESLSDIELKYDAYNWFLPMVSFFAIALNSPNACWNAFEATRKELGISSLIGRDMLGMSRGDHHYTSIMTIVISYLKGLILDPLVKHVSFNPFEEPENNLNIKTKVNKGKILVYSPNTNSFFSDVIGRLIKAKFFAATFDRDDRPEKDRGNKEIKRKKRPVAYVCDEFHRFITGDRESGERSFLDTCRAYRGMCVLATQSIASIKKGLRDSGVEHPDDDISIILNNATSKLYFRNTDVDTQKHLQGLFPANTVNKPISTLQIGECYYMLANGNLGRGQIKLEKPNISADETEKSKPDAQTDNSDDIYQSVHELIGGVDAGSTLSLCKQIDSAVKSKYRRVRIEICSPGGSVDALEHYLVKLGEWRKRGVTFETVSLISTASAAAVILSMGDIGHRKAYSSASLVYHYTRIPKLDVVTKAVCDQTGRDLKKTDDKLISALVHHIYDNDNPKARDSIKLKSLHESLLKHEPKLSLSSLSSMNDPEDDDKGPVPLSDEMPSRKKYEAVLRELFLNDRPINPEEAKLLGLIDKMLPEDEKGEVL